MEQDDHSPAQPDIQAVVVAYRSAGSISECLDSLVGAHVRRVVVVDNSRDPQTCSLVQKVQGRHDAEIVYHEPPANLGFAGGANLGASLCEPGGWLVFVGPDVALTGDLSRLVSFARAQGAALTSGVLLPGDQADGTNVRPEVTPSRELLRALVGTRRTYRTLRVAEEGCHSVPQLDGCLLLTSYETFSLLGGFDERFELYFEDVDLCRRAAAAGGVWLVPEVFGRHAGGASSSQVHKDAYCAFRISRVRYLRKWWGGRGAAVGLAAALLEWLARTASRQPEGSHARARALVLQLQELLEPGRAWVLPDGASGSRGTQRR